MFLRVDSIGKLLKSLKNHIFVENEAFFDAKIKFLRLSLRFI